MLNIKDVSIFKGMSIRIMFTVDGPEDITILAQILSPMAQSCFAIQNKDETGHVYEDVIELGKYELRHLSTNHVFMVRLSRCKVPLN